MPPRKDFRQPREATSGNNQGVGGSADGDDEHADKPAIIREHPMKKMQAKSHDGHGITLGLNENPMTKGNLLKDSASALKLNRSNDLLAQSSTETLLDMLKAHAGIKDCSEDTVQHINGVSIDEESNNRQ